MNHRPAPSARVGVEHHLLLASASPRRREMLQRLALPLSVCGVDVDEAVNPGESPSAYLERIVSAKLSAAGALPQAAGCAAVLVADTVVVRDGRILGKPRDDSEALSMLQLLAGACHQVSTRFAFAAAGAIGAVASQSHAETVTTDVWFRESPRAELERYVATGEGRDKAGGYAIQGIGAFLVERVGGSYTNVVGLPLCEVVRALQHHRLLGLCPWRPTDGAPAEG